MKRFVSEDYVLTTLYTIYGLSRSYQPKSTNVIRSMIKEQRLFDFIITFGWLLSYKHIKRRTSAQIHPSNPATNFPSMAYYEM